MDAGTFTFTLPGNLAWTLAPAFKKFPGYEADIQWHEDPEWQQYQDVLYPSEEEMQGIQDRNVVANLRQHGDPLTAARPVTHWSFFSERAARDAFIDQVTAEGFHLVNAEDVDPEHVRDGRKYLASYERTDLVDDASINNVTLSLFRLSKRYGGDYDGWETVILKPQG